MRRPRVRLLVLAQLLSVGFAAGALAVPDDALRCQSAIGAAGRAYAVARLRAFVECNNDVVGGRVCDEDQRDRVVARAARALARTTTQACRNVALEALNFPGRCPDGTGGAFTSDDLHRCLAALHDGLTNDGIAVAYPALQASSGLERRCQRGLAVASSAYVAAALRIRTRCLDARLLGSLPASVDCRATAPPYSPGSGDAATDDALRRATVRVMSRVHQACAGADLTRLGLIDECVGVVGGPFDLPFVENCVQTLQAYVVRDLLAVEYPLPPRPTPIPTTAATPVPTPALESLQLSPVAASKPVGGVQRFLAVAHLSDDYERNFTQRVRYSSSDESVAVCPNKDGDRSKVLAIGVGTASIIATEPITGITSEAATLVVVPCHDACVAGAALTPACDPCVATICAARPSCCVEGWGELCVDAVSLCGGTCPPSSGG